MPGQTNFSQTTGPQIKAGWLPVLVGALLCTLVFVLWWTLDEREQTNLHNKVKAEADYLATHIDADLRNRIPTLLRMARRWEIRGGTPKEEFISDARAYLSDVPGFQFLGWVDKNFYVRWVVPLEGNERVQNLNLAFEEKRRIALDKAKATGSPTMTAPIDLMQGGKGFLIYFPIYVRGEFKGFILAVFRIQGWLEYIFSIREHHNVSDDFRIAVFFDDIPVFKQAGWDDLQKSGLEAIANTEILDHRFFIHTRPTQTYIEHNKTLLPKLTALFGILLAVLVSLIVYLYQKASVETWGTHVAKTALEVEMREHKKTEDELQHTLSRLDMATKAGGIGVWTWDVSTGILIWNERMYNLYDIPSDVTPTYETWRNAVHPDDLPATESLLKNAVEGKAVFNTEFRIILTTGAVRYLGAAARVERDHTGKPQGVTGITWDLTDRRQAEETVKRSEEQVRLLLNSTAEAIYGIDLQGNCIFANPSCLRMLGYADTEQLLGRNMHRLIHHSHPDGSPMAIEECSIYRAFREGTGMHRDDEVLWKADGSSFPVEYWSYPEIVNGEVSGAVVTFIDITERKQAEEEIKQSEAKLKEAQYIARLGNWELDLTKKTLLWSNGIYELFEINPMEFRASYDAFLDAIHPDDREMVDHAYAESLKKRTPYEISHRLLMKDGRIKWVNEICRTEYDQQGNPLKSFGIVQDITERKQAEEKIHHMATHDVLTDLPSLSLAKDRLSIAFGMARRHKTTVAVMFIDLDGFKEVNDTLGHDAGDYVLKQVAQRLLSCVRETDTAARVGGDEFLLIATELHSSDDAARIAEKAIRVVSQPVIFNGRQAVIGTSIGIALYPEHGEDMDQLIKQADEAMYRIKNAGKNGFSFANTAIK